VGNSFNRGQQWWKRKKSENSKKKSCFDKKNFCTQRSKTGEEGGRAWPDSSPDTGVKKGNGKEEKTPGGNSRANNREVPKKKKKVLERKKGKPERPCKAGRPESTWSTEGGEMKRNRGERWGKTPGSPGSGQRTDRTGPKTSRLEAAAADLTRKRKKLTEGGGSWTKDHEKTAHPACEGKKSKRGSPRKKAVTLAWN